MHSAEALENKANRVLRIGQLAKALNTTAKTLRFYEQIGLLPAATRTAGGYRVYDEAAIRRVRLVLALRRINLSIEEVRALLESDESSPLRLRLVSLLQERLRQVELDLGVLQGQRDDLAARLDNLLATPRVRPADCVCEALSGACTCGRYVDHRGP